jgi:hypothetical protein
MCGLLLGFQCLVLIIGVFILLFNLGFNIAMLIIGFIIVVIRWRFYYDCHL